MRSRGDLRDSVVSATNIPQHVTDSSLNKSGLHVSNEAPPTTITTTTSTKPHTTSWDSRVATEISPRGVTNSAVAPRHNGEQDHDETADDYYEDADEMASTAPVHSSAPESEYAEDDLMSLTTANSLSASFSGSLASSGSSGSTSTTSSGSSSFGLSELMVRRLKTGLNHWCQLACSKSSSHIALPLCIFQFIQLLSFALDPTLGWEELNSGWTIFLKVISFTRTLGVNYNYKSILALEIAFSVYMACLCLVGVLVMWQYSANLQYEGKLASLLHLEVEFFSTVLYAPLAHTTLALIGCGAISPPGMDASCRSGTMISQSILMCVLLILGTLIAFISTASQYDFCISSKHPLARFLSRIEICQFLTVLLASCFTRYLRYPAISVAVCQGMVALVVCFGCASCNLYILWYAPYYKWWANYMKIAGFTTVLVATPIAFFHTIFPDNSTNILIAVVCTVGVVPVICYFGTMTFFYITNLRLKRNLGKILYSEESADQQVIINKLSQSLRSTHLIVCHLYWDLTSKTSATNNTRDALDTVSRLLMAVIESHSGPYPEILYSLFTLQQSDELQTVAIHIQRAQNSPHQWPDTKLLVTRLEEYRREKTRAFDGGNEEIDLGFKEAEKHHKKAQEGLAMFWQQLYLRNLGSLPDIVAMLDSAEKNATQIYEKLKKRFPKSSKVLRQFASFLEQVKNDPQQAQVMYTTADMLEESTTRHHKNRKHFRQNQVAPLEDVESDGDATKLKHIDQSTEHLAHTEVKSTQHHKAIQDSQKLQWYKDHVSTMESSVVRQLYLSIFIVLAVVLVNTTITYAFSRWALSGFVFAYKETAATSNLTSLVPYLNYLVEKQAIGLKHPEYNHSTALAELKSIGMAFQDIDKDLYIDSAMGNAVDFGLWTQKVHNISTWDEATKTRSSLIVSLAYLLEEYSRRAVNLADSADNHTDSIVFESDPDSRFMLDNGYSVIRPALEQLTHAYRESVLSQVKSSRLLLAVLLPVTVIIVSTCVGVFFLRSIYLIRKERLEVLRLFLYLSRSTVQHIYESCTKKNQGLATNASFASIDSRESITSAELSQTQVNSIKMKFVTSVTLRFLIGVGVLLIFIVAISTFAIASLHQFEGPLDLTSARISERSTLQRVHTAAASLIGRDFITWGDMEGLHHYLGLGLQSYDDAQNKTSGITRTWHVELASESLRSLLLYRNCTDIALSHCEGLEEIDNIFISAAVSLNDIPDVDATVGCEQWQTMDRVDQLGLWPWHLELESSLLELFLNQLEQYQAILTALFAASWPIAAIVYAVLHLPLKHIRQQHFHTLRMFLLIPVEVIENTPQIKHFLETGEKMDATVQMRKMLRDTQTKTERLIQAAADAVIIVDFSNLIIETFNTAAETMFGWSSSEIVGSHLARLLCKEWLESQKEHASEKNTEAVGFNKEGIQFPVLISKSTAALESGTVAILIVRDVREIRGYQELLEQNENLLLKMLPKTIAQRLKNSIASAKDKTQPLLIADSHPQVSILFADIVKFSEWSTTIDAEKLVEILNGIVSVWDLIALSFKVEKIKTIGDCYMCVCGCPESNDRHAPTLLRFATEMLYSLEEFNKTKKTDLHVRIGINSGPVVAGVIGLSKVMYDIWSPSVNMASRMESSGVPDAIQITDNTARLLGHEFHLEPRGEVEIKGGYKVAAWLYRPPPANSQNRHPIIAEIAQARPHSASSVSTHSSVHAWGKLLGYGTAKKNN
ncbi:Family 3 adenylate cyclase [Pelomyxa schiedti]|nr:Family 3 adenylate cyclase [Pelomyxa schiedti]